MPRVGQTAGQQPQLPERAQSPAQTGELGGKKISDLLKEIKEFKTKEPISIFRRIVVWVQTGVWINRGDVTTALDKKFRELQGLLPKIEKDDQGELAEGIKAMRAVLSQLRGVGASEPTLGRITTIEKDLTAFEASINNLSKPQESVQTHSPESPPKHLDFSRLPPERREDTIAQLAQMREQMRAERDRKLQAAQSNTTGGRSDTNVEPTREGLSREERVARRRNAQLHPTQQELREASAHIQSGRSEAAAASAPAVPEAVQQQQPAAAASAPSPQESVQTQSSERRAKSQRRQQGFAAAMRVRGGRLPTVSEEPAGSAATPSRTTEGRPVADLSRPPPTPISIGNKIKIFVAKAYRSGFDLEGSLGQVWGANSRQNRSLRELQNKDYSGMTKAQISQTFNEIERLVKIGYKQLNPVAREVNLDALNVQVLPQGLQDLLEQIRRDIASLP